MKIRAIAINTFREAARNKVFYLLIVVGLVFVLSSRVVSLLVIGDRVQVLKDIGLAAINFFSVLIAIFTGINLVFKEIDKKTVYNILSKPISRHCFILGKFLGLAFTLLVALGSMMLVFSMFLLLAAGEFDWRLLIYFLLLYSELLIITAVSLVFSSFSTPILSSIFTIIVYLIGHVVWTFNEFKHRLVDPVVKIVAYVMYYILPNLEKYNIKDQLVMGESVRWNLVGYSLLYAALYISALLLLSVIIFNRREFQ